MPNNSVLKWCAVSGLAAQGIFFVSWFVTSLFEGDGYSHWRDYTSDLGSLTAAHPVPYNIGISLSGALTVPLAVAVFFVFRRSRAGRIGAILLAVFGIGQFLDGIWREDCAPRMAACKALEESQGFSWHHQAHDIESLFTFTALVAAPLVFAPAFRRAVAWRSESRVSWFVGVTLVVVTAAFLVVALMDEQPAAGALERLLVTLGTGWMALVAWRLWAEVRENGEGPMVAEPPA